jgi:steroid delta-isomerase-like uncharacterized protein
MSEENKAIVRRFSEPFEEFWRTGDVDALDEVLAPDFVYHQPMTPPDREGFKQTLPMFRAAFPDMRYTIEDMIAEGDKVMDRIAWQATHQGEMMGIPPTGNTVRVTAIHMSRIAEGKIVERWGQPDNLDLMQQIGAIPEPGQKQEARAAEGEGEEKGLMDKAKDKLMGQ